MKMACRSGLCSRSASLAATATGYASSQSVNAPCAERCARKDRERSAPNAHAHAPAPARHLRARPRARAAAQGRRRAARPAARGCADCGRTPLVGERVHRLPARRRRSASCAGPGAARRPSARSSRARTASTATRSAARAPRRRRDRRPGTRLAAAVDPVTVAVTIDRPREEVFEYLADIANHAGVHRPLHGRLAPDARGHLRPRAPARATASRRRSTASRGPTRRSSRSSRPRRIVEVGRTGKFNRIRTLGVYELEPASGDVDARDASRSRPSPKMLSDKLLESLGARGWIKRKLAQGDAPAALDPRGGPRARHARRRSPAGRASRRPALRFQPRRRERPRMRTLAPPASSCSPLPSPLVAALAAPAAQGGRDPRTARPRASTSTSAS